MFACRYLCPAGSCLRLVAGMFPSRDIGFVWPGRFLRAVHIDTRLFDHPGLHRACFGACELRASFDSRRLGKDLKTGGSSKVTDSPVISQSDSSSDGSRRRPTTLRPEPRLHGVFLWQARAAGGPGARSY